MLKPNPQAKPEKHGPAQETQEYEDQAYENNPIGTNQHENIIGIKRNSAGGNSPLSLYGLAFLLYCLLMRGAHAHARKTPTATGINIKPVLPADQPLPSM
ncbi:unnamed protein product [Ambrosiozyma monospora]|uniref:Unnamed protein product n=1 Tax=Ambrosiozyma monospora TaxID=43982 RepID=A0A9W6WLH9_AMBMO|nr:unnamed protein product [Ambrosiozyma monospora]